MNLPVPSDTAAELALIFVTSLGGGAVAFLLVYWIWLRRFARRVGDLQDTVVALAAALAPGLGKGQAPSRTREKGTGSEAFDALAEAVLDEENDADSLPDAGPARSGAVRMLVEGRDIEIVSAEGGEEIRIEETPERPLTPQERDRIIAYLRNEGFLP
ncbi:hypothetical protein SAMN05444156_1851 [Verrucomicrobium sp. GAS474]|uniref:hypothetical protein n=1 Tax=Verrucomicrobium sp. GAS474 TaxID=1882831 RepID=UPI00087928F4|nr:hypothetical protein [Verrucomicrobium sp. GAS474]SDU08165.1 hypothetical protein SAMN05444156_1851 [Verrucomicrobium sp. GAS474]